MTAQGILLAAVLGGAAAIVTLIVFKFWPKGNEALTSGRAKLLRHWRRFAGLDD